MEMKWLSPVRFQTLRPPPLTLAMFYKSVFWGILWWDVFVVRRFHSTPLTLEKYFFKWIRNMIISFSYCKVKVKNDYLTLLVNCSTPLKAQIHLLKRLVFIVCIDNVIKTTTVITNQTLFKKSVKPPQKNFRLPRILLHGPWPIPGYGPEFN